MNQNAIIGQGAAPKQPVSPTGEVFEQVSSLGESLRKTADLAEMLISRLDPVLSPVVPEGDAVSCGGSIRATLVGQELYSLTVRADSIGDRLASALKRLALP